MTSYSVRSPYYDWMRVRLAISASLKISIWELSSVIESSLELGVDMIILFLGWLLFETIVGELAFFCLISSAILAWRSSSRLYLYLAWIFSAFSMNSCYIFWTKFIYSTNWIWSSGLEVWFVSCNSISSGSLVSMVCTHISTDSLTVFSFFIG